MEADRVGQILEAACRVIARDGWHGMRMDAVAREAGVSKALVHYYFSKRRELLGSAFLHSEERANARVEGEIAQLDDPAERLERFLLVDFDEEPVFSENRSLWSEVWSGMRLDADLRPDVERAYRHWVARLVELVEEAREQEEYPRETDAEDAAWRIAALVDGLESLLLLGLVTPEATRRLVHESIADVLSAHPAPSPGGRGRPK